MAGDVIAEIVKESCQDVWTEPPEPELVPSWLQQKPTVRKHYKKRQYGLLKFCALDSPAEKIHEHPSFPLNRICLPKEALADAVQGAGKRKKRPTIFL